MTVNLPKLLASIILCLGVGSLGSFFTVSEIASWYATLQKPFFSPPNYLFGPVWTILYILMGVSLAIVWSSKKKGKEKAIKLFLIQLALNFFWSIIFFAWHSPELAFIEIIVMWIFIFLTIKAFLPISKISAYLLYPYLAWVSFASILNLFVAILN
jgi:benzodiazapine receptor